MCSLLTTVQVGLFAFHGSDFSLYSALLSFLVLFSSPCKAGTKGHLSLRLTEITGRKFNGKFPGTTLSSLKFFLQEMTFSEPLSTFLPNSSYTIFLPLKIAVNKTTLQLFCGSRNTLMKSHGCWP